MINTKEFCGEGSVVDNTDILEAKALLSTYNTKIQGSSGTAVVALAVSEVPDTGKENEKKVHATEAAPQSVFSIAVPDASPTL